MTHAAAADMTDAATYKSRVRLPELISTRAPGITTSTSPPKKAFIPLTEMPDGRTTPNAKTTPDGRRPISGRPSGVALFLQRIGSAPPEKRGRRRPFKLDGVKPPFALFSGTAVTTPQARKSPSPTQRKSLSPTQRKTQTPTHTREIQLPTHAGEIPPPACTRQTPPPACTQWTDIQRPRDEKGNPTRRG